MNEVIFIVTLLGGLWAWAWFLTGKARIFWLSTMGIIALIVLAAERIGKVTIGHTISQLYWDWSLRHVTTHWLVMGIMLAGWLSLLYHLSSKVLKGKNEQNNH